MSSIEAQGSGGAAVRPARRRLKEAAPLTDAAIRKFGLVMLAGFGLFGALLRWRGHPAGALVLWAAGAAIGLLAVAAPGPARPVYRAWMAGAHVLGRINTTLVLGLCYLVVFTGIGLVFRLIGRDALKLGFDRDAKTYWEPKRMPVDAKSYFDQF